MVAAGRPWFLWDVEVSDADLRARLRHKDTRPRAVAGAREVWKHVTLREVLASEKTESSRGRLAPTDFA
ncbi:MAG: hypothetical protein AB1938_03515 [Myxococcota bacterium]